MAADDSGERGERGPTTAHVSGRGAHGVDAPSSTAARLAALAFGTLLALAIAMCARSCAPSALARPGPVAVWAVDRDAHRLVGLDQDLIVARQVRVERPLEVEACADGGAWVLRSADGTA